MSEAVSISAVVISYQGVEFIADCLNSLKDDLVAYDHEIIVVDNHSIDGTVKFIETEHPDITLIKNDSNLGFARAVNQGIERANNDFLWLLNQDIRICPGCLDALLDCHRRLAKPGIIGPRLVGFDGTLQKFCRRFPRYHHLIFELSGLAYLFPRSGLFNSWKMGEFDHTDSREVEQPMGAAMLIDRKTVYDVGLLDESFGIFFNDVDFCHRLVNKGYANYYLAEAVIEHYGGGSISRKKPRMVWLSHFSMFRYFLKQENLRDTPAIIKILRRPLPYLAGLLLILSAIPRSLYHLIRKII
jgi:GT2 family glycosyltransferase